MSFSKETKAELCAAAVDNEECQKSLAYGMVLFSRYFGRDSLSLTTECRPVVDIYSRLIPEITGVIVEIKSAVRRHGGESSIYTVSVPDQNECEKIYRFFGYHGNDTEMGINDLQISRRESLPYFLRGAFLSCGNVTDPEKDYHLELIVPHRKTAYDLERVISGIKEIHTEPNVIQRKGSYVVYIKGSENIADMLTYIGAPMSALNLIQSKIFKSVRNNVNRKINSETANIKKTADASARQLKAIEYIIKKRGLEYLPDDLRELAQIRIDNPEYNLRELGEALSKPISRSGVNHRIQRILEIAEDLKDQ